jgi:D-alanyl-D-alanine carboxypeptidase (penicillin-binding protein 5/6)
MYRLHSRVRRALVAVAGAAFAASLALTAFAPAASAKIPLPTVTALHAYIADPAYAGTQAGDLIYGKKPYEQTAMGSTTKIWTLDLAAQALANHFVSVNDLVTINADEASHLPPNESSMTDVNGKPLEKGEIVKFGDLIRGMMYPSGNNAAYAIADHLARTYYGPGSDWHDFVGMMNGFASSLGQTHTHFTNPAGLDNNAHYTTAQELAKEFQHGLQDPFFAQVVGFKGTYTATTTGPNGPKAYKWSRNSGYAGWEGEKNGVTPNCTGPAKGCLVRAATRIGRRVVVSTMQGTAGAEENAMLDYGFASIFHPDLDGSSKPASAVDKQALDCFGSDNAVTATLLSSGAVNLTLWKKAAGSISQVQSAAVLGAAGGGDVAVTRLSTGDIVVGTIRGGKLTLARWTTAGTGSLHLLANDILAGPASTVALQPVSTDMFLSAVVASDGRFALNSWQLQGTSLVHLDTYVDGSSSNPFSEVAISGPLQTDVFGGTNAVTAEIQGPDLHVTTWAVDPATGSIAMAGITRNLNSNFRKVSIAPVGVTPQPWEQLFTPTYYALGHTVPGGLRTDFLRLGGGEFGGPATPQYQGSTPVIAGDWIKLAALGTGGVMAAVDIPGESVQLQAWDAHRNLNDSITPTQVAQETEPAATSLNLCRIPLSLQAEGRFFTGTNELDGQFHVRAYRSGDRPF